MPKLKIRNFKGLNTVYDSADIDIEFFTEYKNICTKYGYIIPEVVTIEKFKEINNLVHIQEIYLDNDKLANKLVGDGYWAKSESNYVQDIKKYLLVVSKNTITIYDNNNEVYVTSSREDIINVNIINSKGIVKITINNKNTYIIHKVDRYYRYNNIEDYEYHGISIDKTYSDIKLDIPFNNEVRIFGGLTHIYLNNVREPFYNERITNFPFEGLDTNATSEHYKNFIIAVYISSNETDDTKRDYFFFEGLKFKLINRTTNNAVNNFAEKKKDFGLGIPNSNEIGFVKYINVLNGQERYVIQKQFLLNLISNEKYEELLATHDYFYLDNRRFEWSTGSSVNNFLWGYKTSGTITFKGQTNFVINGEMVCFYDSQAVINFMNLLNTLNGEECAVKKIVNLDAEGLSSSGNNNLEIVTTCVFDNQNEFVCSYYKNNLATLSTKFIIELTWDYKKYLEYESTNYLNKRVNKLYFYYRTNTSNDFEQFHMIDLQSQYNDNPSNMYISLNTGTGVFLAQTIGYAYLPSDYETNRSNKALIEPNSILNINGIQIGLWGQNIVYPAVGRGKILEDIYYKFNIVPDVEGDWLVNISNTLGVYNIDRRELYLLDVRNQENVLLFYLKESVPYVINKYDDIIYTPIGVIIMTNKGIILFDGKQNTLLSQNINNLVEDNYKTSNIFYDKLNQHLHFINTRWYRYDFQTQIWNEFEIPVNDLGKDIIPQKLINYDNQLLVRHNNVLYKVTYNNNAVGFLTCVKFQNAQDNVKIQIDDITYDEEVNGIRKITKQFIPLKNRKFKDYLEFSTTVKNKLYSFEIDIEAIELNNMKLLYPKR